MTTREIRFVERLGYGPWSEANAMFTALVWSTMAAVFEVSNVLELPAGLSATRCGSTTSFVDFDAAAAMVACSEMTHRCRRLLRRTRSNDAYVRPHRLLL